MSVRSSDKQPHHHHHEQPNRGSSTKRSSVRNNSEQAPATSTATSMRHRVQALYEEVMFERRVLLGCTACVGLAIFLWLISICTDYWFTVSAPTSQGVFINETKRFFLYSHSGLWRICRTSYGNASDPENSILSKL